MGLYKRPDSRFWWMLLEATGERRSTGVPLDGGSPLQDKELARQARAVYAKAQATAVVTPPTQAKPIISFRQQADWFETHHSAHIRSKDQERSMLRRLTQAFGHVKDVRAIDESRVKEWMTERAAQVSRSTVNRELDVLKAVLRSAVPKYLDTFPLGEVRRFRLPESEPRVLSVDEEARLLAICGPEDKALILTALDTLLRLSSVIRLEWPQVKFPLRSILPLNAKVSTDAKPMSTRLYDALSAIRRPGGYVFESLHGGLGETAAKNRAIRRFAELCDAAEITRGRARDGLTFHCLRHTGATRALQRGASLRTVMKLGGWKNAQTVLRYLHVADADVIAAAESIGNHVTRT